MESEKKKFFTDNHQWNDLGFLLFSNSNLDLNLSLNTWRVYRPMRRQEAIDNRQSTEKVRYQQHQPSSYSKFKLPDLTRSKYFKQYGLGTKWSKKWSLQIVVFFRELVRSYWRFFYYSLFILLDPHFLEMRNFFWASTISHRNAWTLTHSGTFPYCWQWKGIE